MDSRERVLTALDHREPDRVPIDLGSSVVTSIALSTYASLREYVGLPARPDCVMETVQQIACVDQDVLDLFGVDVLPVFANPPSSYQVVIIDEPAGTLAFKDEFGAVLRKPKDSYYFDWQEFPLAEPSISALENMT